MNLFYLGSSNEFTTWSSIPGCFLVFAMFEMIWVLVSGTPIILFKLLSLDGFDFFIFSEEVFPSFEVYLFFS
jgi:hypothetical protein